MGRIAQVLEFTRRVLGGNNIAETKADPGGNANKTFSHFGPSGYDAQPLPGDFVATSDSAGSGREHVTGYSDPKNAGKAGAGESRTYARDPVTGAVVCEIWLKSPGRVAINSIAPGSVVEINGVTIDRDGNISTPGDVTANEGASSVTLTTHVHSTAMGPSGSPTPGT